MSHTDTPSLMVDSHIALPHLLLPQHPYTVWGSLAAVVNALFRVALIPLLLTPLVDKVLVQQDMSAVPPLIVLAGFLVIIGAVALWLQDSLLGQVGAWLSQRWRAGIYQHALHHPLPAGLNSGGFASRLLSDLKEVELFLQYGLGSLIAESLSLLGILAVLFYFNAMATLTLLLSVLPVVWVMAWLGRKLEQHSQQTQAGLEHLGGHLQEGFARRLLLGIFNAQAFALERFAQHNQQTQQQQYRRVQLAALQTPLAQILGFIALLLVIGRLLASDMSSGEIMSYVTLVALLSTPAQLLPRAYGYLQMARAAATRLHALREYHRQQPSHHTTVAAVHSLTLDKVSFRYPDSPVLLAELELELGCPNFIVISGDSGQGKSTLLKLLLGQLTPSAGTILLNGIPLEQISNRHKAQLLSYVPQTPQLFQASIAENLRLGRDISESALWQVMQRVGLTEAVRRLPKQLEQPLQEADSHSAAGLSVGQQQRLSLARALLAQPAILILDEANANLDETSEQVMLECLHDYAQTALVIMVSHRPMPHNYASQRWQLSQQQLVRLDKATPIP